MNAMAAHVLHAESSFLEAGERRGLLAWVTSTDHKRIAILYLVCMLTFFLVGAAIGILMRLEQLTMGPTIMQPQTYNAMFTLHGVIMIFLFVIPGLPAVM